MNVTLAGDKFAALNAPTAIFSFDIADTVSDIEMAENEKAEKESIQNVVVEMNQQELTRFVAQLEQMNLVMRDNSI